MWKVSEQGVFFGSLFPVSGVNAEIYYVDLRIQFKCGKYRPENTLYPDTFRAVYFDQKKT